MGRADDCPCLLCTPGIYTECGVRGSGIFSGSGPKHEAEDESNILNIFLYLKFDICTKKIFLYTSLHTVHSYGMLKSSNKSETIIFVVGLRLYPTRVIFIQSVEVSLSIFNK